MTDSSLQFAKLEGEQSCLVLTVDKGVPQIRYWGKMLPAATCLEQIALMSHRDEAPASPKVEVPISLCPTLGAGFHGHPGVILQNNSSAWCYEPRVSKFDQESPSKIIIKCEDSLGTFRLVHTLEFVSGDMLCASTTVTNLTQDCSSLQWCAALTFPIEERCTHFTTLSGLWAGEFQKTTQALNRFPFVRDNRRGRTSHDNFPGLLVHPLSTTEGQGECFGLHLAWSGNHKLHLEKLTDGRSYLQMGDLLLPGEIQLSPGETYESPNILASYSPMGFSGLSQNFHAFALQKTCKHFKPAVGFNTWEARYFDHNPDDLLILAEQAAQLGCERFVLDDGWFTGRRHDRSGLGDWQVDKSIYPEGLDPLILHLKSLGLEFGLWIEPEMVNVDSDLYRAHPNWLLGTPENTAVEFRHQRVLDFSQPEVYDHILKQILGLLSRYDIAYIKWDMNRDINQPGRSFNQFQPRVNQHVNAVYRMMDDIKDQFPKLQIESCASGGGRVDFGILDYSQRFWTSDATDAHDRLSIQYGYSLFFPLALMGSHVGPSPSPITKRKLSMSFRAGVAFWGQMGCELDPTLLNDEERKELKEAIRLHKEFRCLLHSGRFHRLSDNEISQSFCVMALDKSEGLFAYVQIHSSPHSQSPKLYFPHLLSQQNYRIKVLWPSNFASINYATISSISNSSVNSFLLENVGLQLPRLPPESIIIFHLKKSI